MANLIFTKEIRGHQKENSQLYLTCNCSSRAAVAVSPLFSSTTTTMCVREFTFTCSASKSFWSTCAQTQIHHGHILSIKSDE